MSWNVYDKVEQERLLQMQLEALAGADDPEPEPLAVTREMRHAVVGEILQHVRIHLPSQYDWIVRMTLLDYGCRALAAEPDDDA